jgi:hypothetical protein
MTMRPLRRLLAVPLLTLACAHARAPAAPPPPPAGAAKAAAIREITWDELVPKDWDPLKQFKDMNFGVLSDADPRAVEMLRKMREVWDNAPVEAALDGQAIRLPGYVVPLEESKAGVREFLLVPYFGACIHTPPPPSNQIVHVRLAQPRPNLRSMDTVWVNGTLKTLRSDTFMGASGYRMDATAVQPYVAKTP